jgi:hypothetical protein
MPKVCEANIVRCDRPSDSLAATHVTQVKAAKNAGIIEARIVVANCEQRPVFWPIDDEILQDMLIVYFSPI